jgi:hypothetical protein
MWLEKEWRENNAVKYQHYFSEWANNLTEIQIKGFDRMRLGKYIK